MDLFTTDNKEAKCTICGNNLAPDSKSTMSTLIPIYDMVNQDNRNVEALFIHLECLNLTAVRMSDCIMIAQKIEEDKSGSS